MARKPMSLASNSRAKKHAPFDLFITQVEPDWDEPSEDIIEAINASLYSRYEQELTPYERSLRRMGE